MPMRDQIAALIPHQGEMCLWDEVVGWDATHGRLRAHRPRDIHHPLRSGGQLRALHLCEYGAQAMAVHGGLRARAAGATAPPGSGSTTRCSSTMPATTAPSSCAPCTR